MENKDLAANDWIWCHTTPVAVASGGFEDHDQPRTLVRFIGPIRPEWKTFLLDAGIRIEFWAPPCGACLTLPAQFSPSRLREFKFLAGAIAYRQEHCQRDEPRAVLMPGELVDVVTFGRESTPLVESQLRDLGIEIVSRSSSKLRVRFSGNLALLRDLTGVKLAGGARESVLLDSVGGSSSDASGQTVAFWNTPPTVSAATLDGRGEVIAVADTGLDRGIVGPNLHPDFQARVALIKSWPVNESWSSFVTHPGSDDGGADRNTGHGTHVAGVALGDGTAGGSVHRGAAPAARLVFQSLEQFCEIKPELQGQIRSGYYLSGRPFDIRALFQQARDQGARIHINSWGDPAAGAYTNDCFEADLFLHENPDAVVLFAAGNDGGDLDCDGRIDPSSLYAPASAKNVIAIGATEGPFANTGLRRTWGDFDPTGRRYPIIQDRADSVSGQPNRVAYFSSAGPTADGRIKPDLCVPGTNIAGPRSQACNATGWGLADPLPWYMYDGGTSTANGIAGGMAALVRQAWREASGDQAPSGAAIKALLILGVQPVRGRSTFEKALPREAGYGLANLAGSLPGPRIWLFGDRSPGLQTGDRLTFPLEIASAGRIRAVLCWYDAPGERLINDLDLSLTLPSGSDISAGPDRVNTVEIVEAGMDAAGHCAIQVVGYNVPDGPQVFAVAVAHFPS